MHKSVLSLRYLPRQDVRIFRVDMLLLPPLPLLHNVFSTCSQHFPQLSVTSLPKLCNTTYFKHINKCSSFSMFSEGHAIDLCCWLPYLTLLHSERPKFHRDLAVLSAIGLKGDKNNKMIFAILGDESVNPFFTGGLLLK